MAQWKYTIDISSECKQYEEGKLSIPQICKVLIVELCKIKEYEYDSELIHIVGRLQKCGNVERFDNILTKLYDWSYRNGKIMEICSCWAYLF